MQQYKNDNKILTFMCVIICVSYYRKLRVVWLAGRLVSDCDQVIQLDDIIIIRMYMDNAQVYVTIFAIKTREPILTTYTYIYAGIAHTKLLMHDKRHIADEDFMEVSNCNDVHLLLMFLYITF